MKILITGTHLTPAVSVIEEFKKMDDIQIVYVGRETTMEGDDTESIESKIIPLLGVKFIPLTAGRLQREFTIHTIPSLLKLPIGFIQALFIIIGERPDVLLSFGGYISVPLIFWAYFFSIPIIAHQQTLVENLSAKFGNIFADKVAVSFPQNLKNSDNYILTGNPLREEIIRPKNINTPQYKNLFNLSTKDKLPVVLITGGNQGSHKINKAIENCLRKILKIACLIHVTGDNSFKDFENLSKFQNEKYIVKKWIGNEWGSLLSKVDLVVSRAGINTLLELSYFKRFAIVIPIPYLYNDEQNENAKFFENLGLVKILPQSKLSGKKLLDYIKMCFNDLNHLSKKVKQAKNIVIVDASKRLALETILLRKIV